MAILKSFYVKTKCKYCGIEMRIEGEDANKKNVNVCSECKKNKNKKRTN